MCIVPVMNGATPGMLAFALLSGCSFTQLVHDRGERSAASELREAGWEDPVTPETTPSLPREWARWHAQDWQAGVVQQVGSNSFVLVPYLKGIDPIRVIVAPDTAIFNANEPATSAALVPGREVRANFEVSGNGLSHAVSVELLTPDEASRFKRIFLTYPDQPAPKVAGRRR